MQLHCHSLLAASFVLCALTTLRGQLPSNWVTTTLPSNQTSQPNSIGTTVSFLTTDSVWLFSGITKRWTVLPVANPTPIFQANDYCIVQDGNRIHGFAAHTGEVDTITTSGTATIVSGPASSSWVTLVADGSTAYGFGAFHGRWESVALSQPGPTMVSNRLIGLLRDGNTVYGLNAHHGTFVPVAADTAAALQVVGEAEVGTAHSPGMFRAFSAQHNDWVVQPIPTNANLVQQFEYALAWSGNQVWAASGLTGTLATYTTNNPIAGIINSEGVAAFFDGNDIVCYGSGRGRFATMPAIGASVLTKYHFALIVDANGITPFSALSAAFGPSIFGSFSLTTNDEVAFADAGIPSFAYSAILNSWTLLPPTLQPTGIAAVRSSIVVAHATGYVACSARHGTWVPLTTSLPNSYQAPVSGSTFLAFDGAGETAHVFDARLNLWATVTGQAPLTVRISRHTAMAHDGSTAFGFGQPSSEWHPEPLTAVPTRFDTASSIGTVLHGNKISVYSVQGSFSYTGRYPEFTQAINLGHTLVMHQVAPPGSALFFGYGFAPARIAVPSLGQLYIDPATLGSLFWPTPVGTSGILRMDLPIPNNPRFAGTQLHLQNVVVPPAPGTPWLSSSVAPVIF